MPKRHANVDEYGVESKLIGLFIDNAKTYVQLSAGALLLTITFLRDVLRLPKDAPIPHEWLLVITWGCFLLCVITGALYQYLAIKYLELVTPKPIDRLQVLWGLRWAAESPGLVYGLMLIQFYLGALAFTVAAIWSLYR